MVDSKPKIQLTEPQKLWLGTICSKLRNGQPVTVRGLKVELRDRLPRDFNPSEIDSRLLKHEDKITLLGIGLCDPSSESVKHADMVILSVRNLLASNYEIRSVAVNYVSEDTRLPREEVACAFKDLSEFGIFHDSGTTYGQGVDGWATINIDDKAFDGFLKYESVGQILDSIVVGRGDAKSPTSDEDSPENVNWDFFIAHSGKDKLPAQELYGLLALHSRVFLDSECLLPGDDWVREVAFAQRNSRVTLVLISSNVDDAYYAREEIASAVAMAREGKQRHRLVPIYLDASGVDVPYGLHLKHSLYVTPESSVKTISEILLQLLARLTGTPERRANRPGTKVKIEAAPPKTPKTEILEASQDHAAGASIKFARNLLDAIEASKTRCRQTGLQYLTPHLLLALLQIPDGFARRCFDEVVAGLAGKVVRSLQVYVEQELPRLAKGVSEEGAEGYRWRDFSWSELESIRVGADIASQERSPLVTTRHILLGFLRSDSITVGDLRMKLGEEKFALLVDTVINTPDEQKPRIPTLKNGSIFKTPPE
ncbi:MAG: TIR domain-containing protein [Acidobacteria bacterium]|nr:TIR domain-containing protein [Acidobacteriota bacterium]